MDETKKAAMEQVMVRTETFYFEWDEDEIEFWVEKWRGQTLF